MAFLNIQVLSRTVSGLEPPLLPGRIPQRAMATETERLTWTAEEAAVLLGIPARTVRELCAAGTLPAWKPAGHWLIPAWGLKEHIARLTGCPLPEQNGNGVESRAETADRLKELRRLLAEAERVAAELE